MRRLLVVAAMSILFAIAAPLVACVDCQEHFVWPQIDECWFCDDSHCASELCETDGDSCSTTGTGCWDGRGNCDDVWWERNGVLVNPPPTLASTWRLASVRVV